MPVCPDSFRVESSYLNDDETFEDVGNFARYYASQVNDYQRQYHSIEDTRLKLNDAVWYRNYKSREIVLLITLYDEESFRNVVNLWDAKYTKI